jgi:hypothetical protein
MTLIDLISLISLLLSAASFATSSVGRLAKYKSEFLAVGWVLFGFVISRILFTYLPPGGAGLRLQPRVFVWGLVMIVMATVVLVALKKEGTNQAVWIILIFFMLLGINGKSMGLIETFKLRDSEILSSVETDEHSGDFDRAIEILEWMKGDRTREEQQAIDARIAILKSRKAERLLHSQ